MMNKRVWLHVGTEKTGSTAIQGVLFENSSQFRDRGYHVVSSRFKHHGPLRKELAALKTDLLDNVIAEIRSSSCADFVITYEGIYSLQQRSLALLAKRLSAFRVIPVIYLRRRSDKLRSNFAQRVKMGERVAEYSKRLLSRDFVESNLGLDYLRVVSKLTTVFAENGEPDNLRVRIYERSSLINRDVVDDFLSVIGLLGKDESLGSLELSAPNIDANVSIGPAAQYLMVLSRALGVEETERKRLLKILREEDHRKDSTESMVPDEVCRDLDERYAMDDSVLARRFFNRERLFVEPPSFIFKPPSGERFIELIEMIYRGAPGYQENDDGKEDGSRGL